MRKRSAWISFLVALLTAPALQANPGGPVQTPPVEPNRPPSTGTSGAMTRTSSARQEAEQLYAIAYAEVEKAKKDLEKGKVKGAERIFRRALERSERAVGLDRDYHEAWNLVGYSARKLGDFEKAFAAYDRCLAINPDYVPAREYLGEAWLDRGKPEKAREQLAVLVRLNASEEAKELREQIEAYEKAHPSTAVDSAGAAPAPADTTRR